ncbi:MAG: DEAD/DEAH box helicase family protein [Parvibaculaceae bacterium]|nr:DEAD/DEAH box helicase family protein [Parvibaculaceae bacterium]
MSDQERIRRQIAQRLSLRAPQEQSLEILADIIDRIGFEKGLDTVQALETIKDAYPSVEDFEREFPSLCFALATGVGKTRLMGAFVSYLFLTGRSKNFFVLAPNTTIYDKLIQDFSEQASPKYVFKGIAEFAQNPPVIVTGDTWQEGRGVRSSDLFGGNAIINIFNVDKINKDKGKVKRMHEYIGQSYFDYLAGLPDLVLMMDEAHRYRAKAGVKAVEELQPVMGLELTATPKTVGAKSKAFKNVIFDYGLGNAMADGFVKEPAVATRADFHKSDFSQEQLEQIMLEDGIHYHEHVKVELDIYARDSGRELVHPFMLVVAQNTTHADEIKATVESDGFFHGNYKGRVAVVHSNQTGEESDDAMQRLVGLEHDNETEIVIHVNKLKEGWDVNNLYTIVPLRASASDILTEQTLGRGLRLPYGERTGVETVDTLTVIAHDRFDDVISKAREEGSLVKLKEIRIGSDGDVSADGSYVLEAPTFAETTLSGRKAGADGFAETDAPFIFDTEEERSAADVALTLIRQKYERRLTSGIGGLSEDAVQAELVRDVKEVMKPKQGTLEGVAVETDVKKVVEAVTKTLVESTIEIPEIVVIPTRDVTFGFKDFDLADLSSKRYQPISDQILIRNLRTENQRELARSVDGAREEQVENYIVRHLIAFDTIDYDTHADLLYKLAGQVISHLRAYLATEEDVENVALNHGKEWADFIFQQMKEHYWETPTDYQAQVTRGFRVLNSQNFNVSSADRIRDLKNGVVPRTDTKKHVFAGLNKCGYPYQKFDSDDERRFAVLIDSDFEKSVERWIKPGSRQFQIEYASGQGYEPDFVVETDKEKLIVEIKARNELDDETVLAKARAACEWVKYANEHAKENGGKPWSYLLVPGDTVTESATLAGLAAAHRMV